MSTLGLGTPTPRDLGPGAFHWGTRGKICPNYECFAWVWMLQLVGALQRAQALRQAGALQQAQALKRAQALQGAGALQPVQVLGGLLQPWSVSHIG